MSLVLRPERPEDREEILRLTYEAFMTLDYPGRRRLDEHFLLSLLYESGKGIAPLCFAAILDGRIAGHIFYCETAFTRPDGTKAPTLTFGPLSVHPEHQRQGIGRALVSHTLELARGLGFGAVLITGVPDYYPRLGFRRARDYRLTMKDGSAPDAFMAYELIPGYLAGGGVYDTWPEEYDRAEQDEAGYAAFDAAFQKKYAPGQLFFDERSPHSC